MNLYRIEYTIKSSGQRVICNSIGMSQDDVISDITSVVGAITITNLYHMTVVHRISCSIREQIIQDLSKPKNTKKLGRPRKYDMMEMKDD